MRLFLTITGMATALFSTILLTIFACNTGLQIATAGHPFLGILIGLFGMVLTISMGLFTSVKLAGAL